MSRTDIKRLLNDVAEDPSVLQNGREDIDTILQDIVSIEKRHLYGMAQTSAKERQDQINDVIVKALSDNDRE